MIVLVLAIIALVIAAILLIRSAGRDLGAWAIFALALIPILAGVGFDLR